MKICSNKNCKQLNPQPLDKFRKRTSAQDGLNGQCRGCEKSYRQRPEVKQAISEYNKSPKTKEYDRKRGKTSERIANKKKNNRSVSARIYQKKYNNLPKIKEKKKIEDAGAERQAYFKERRDNPKNKLIEKIRRQVDRKNNPGKYASHTSKRRAKLANRTPKWLNKEHLKEIQELYELANDIQWLSEDILTVDHIVPLNGKNVSGLHVPWNLAIIGYRDNCRKSNKFDFTYDNNSWKE